MIPSRRLFTKIMKRKKVGAGARMFPETERSDLSFEGS